MPSTSWPASGTAPRNRANIDGPRTGSYHPSKHMARFLPLDSLRPGTRRFDPPVTPRLALLGAVLVLLAGLSGSSRAATAVRAQLPGTLAADEVKAGMTGYGLSVFRGTSVDSFGLTILGVLKGNRPGADLILARAKGELLERTGIIAGMSGSPVYIGGEPNGPGAYNKALTQDTLPRTTPLYERFSSPPAPPQRSPPQTGPAPPRR